MKFKSSVWLIVTLASAGLLSTVFSSAVLLSTGLSSAALAEDWPQFRGQGGQGRSSEVGLPLKWTETENVA